MNGIILFRMKLINLTEMKTNSTQTETKLAFSKIDKSGTDPNRYSSITSDDEETYFDKVSGKHHSFIPGLSVNIGTVERILMVAAGSYLLYKALSRRDKKIKESLVGGTMLLRGVTGYCPIYEAAEKISEKRGSNINIRTSVNVNKPVHEVYDFWRNLENLPRFMSHLKSVTETDRLTSEWTAKGPAGIGQISWKAQILMDEPGEKLSWSSLPGSTIDNSGKIVFKKVSDNETEIDVNISYCAPLGIAGEVAAKWMNPMFENMVTNDIQSFKTLLEDDGRASQN